MVKGNHVIGLKVIDLTEGNELGKVKDILYSESRQKVEALLLKTAGVFSDGEVVPIESIRSIGDDAVIIESAESIKKISELPQEVADIATGNTYLTKSRIVTESGEDLGKITDIVFDSKTGSVGELEISGGMFNDMESGKKVVHPQDIITVGPDAIIVKNFVEQTFAEQGKSQGLKGVVENVGAKTHQYTDKVKTEVKQVQESLATKAEEIKNNPANQQKVADVKIKAREIDEKLKTGWEKIEAKTVEIEQNVKESLNKSPISTQKDQNPKKFTKGQTKAEIPEGTRLKFPKGTEYTLKKDHVIEE